MTEAKAVKLEPYEANKQTSAPDTTTTVCAWREPDRTLVVSFDGDTPQFEFQGQWAGKHVQMVSRLVMRKYKEYIRNTRNQERRNKNERSTSE
jgi:hypothetical protein